MLNENIKSFRKAKGFSQEELAARLHVVRQTVSKWEQGLSVPDADLLVALSETLETPVSVLLGETATEETDRLQVISEQLERINLQLAQRKLRCRQTVHRVLLALCAGIIAVFAILLAANSPYLRWDFSDPETAVFGAALHAFEYLFVRAAPLVLIGAGVGAFLTRRKS